MPVKRKVGPPCAVFVEAGETGDKDRRADQHTDAFLPQNKPVKVNGKGHIKLQLKIWS